MAGSFLFAEFCRPTYVGVDFHGGMPPGSQLVLGEWLTFGDWVDIPTLGHIHDTVPT